MRKLLLFFVLALYGQYSHAQVAEYYINQTNKNVWDNSMSAWTSWGKWNDVDNDCKYMCSTTKLRVSANVIQYIYSYSYYTKDNIRKWLTQTTTYRLTQNAPTTAYKMNYERVLITFLQESNDYKDTPETEVKRYTKSGTGSLYSKTLNMDQLVAGNAIGTIYFYIEFSPIDKGYYGALVHKKTKEELTKEQEEKDEAEEDRLNEIAELKKEKQQKTVETYKKMGEALKIIFQKKKTKN